MANVWLLSGFPYRHTYEQPCTLNNQRLQFTYVRDVGYLHSAIITPTYTGMVYVHVLYVCAYAGLIL